MDRLWLDLPAEVCGDSSFMDAAIQYGSSPDLAAQGLRAVLGNKHDPIFDVIQATRAANIHVFPMPEESRELVPVRGGWFSDSPESILLVDEEQEQTPKFRHCIASEVGILMLSRHAIEVGYGPRTLARQGARFAGNFLYPDAAVKELRHNFSRQRLAEHALVFGVTEPTIVRRLFSTK